jgi:hypothetical protein
MAECFACKTEFDKSESARLIADRFSDKLWGICPQCRADLELGRLVRSMPMDKALLRGEDKYFLLQYDWLGDGILDEGSTPEEALRALKGE